MIKTILLFRHGETDWNREGLIQGHLDVPLNERGREQSILLQTPLARWGTQAILSSDLSRARETAEIAARILKIPVHTHPGLREIHLGQMQGMSRTEIEEKFGVDLSHQLRHRVLSDSDVFRLGTERTEEVVSRAEDALCAFFRENPSIDVLGISTHGGVLRRLLKRALADRLHEDELPPPAPNAALFPVGFHLDVNKWEYLETNRI